MSPPSRVAAVALFAVLFVGIAAVPVSAASGADIGEAIEQVQTETQADDELESEFEIAFIAELQETGDARWNITLTTTLETDDERDAYRSLSSDFENGEIDPLGLESFEAGLSGVDGQTERDMAITGVERETSSDSQISDGTGVYTVEFTWENFTREEDNLLVIDRDVLVMENGELWFEGLDDSQQLSITAPPEYGVRDASVGAQNGQLQWFGPQQFDETTLQATFIGPGGENNGNGSPSSGSFFWFLIPVAVIGLLVAALLARFDRLSLDLPTAVGTDSQDTDDRTEASGQPNNDGDDAEGTISGPGGTDDEDESGDIDEDLLSDEERVERLLSSNGGRMKQADIVKETDWSNAKVSQLLSSMEEDGQINKLRIGRENLISFPDEDITDTGDE